MSKKISKGEVLALKSWHADWHKIKVAVLGLGVTGFSVADTLHELGAEVQVFAKNRDVERENILHVLGVKFSEIIDSIEMAVAVEEFSPDLVIVSPGIPLQHPVVVKAKELEIPVWGDIELAWRLRDKTTRVADWICVTGTNGKTTTSQLTAHMLHAGGYRVAPVGNIGTPILDAVRDPLGFDVLVVELSSFQLERLGEISPYSSVCLNISDDHLDWHGGRTEYERAKAKIFNGVQVACVYNRQDAKTLKMVEEADVVEGARAVSFGLDTPGVSELGVIENLLIDRSFHDERRKSALEIISTKELDAKGLSAPHLIQDVLAATALARSYGVKAEQIHDALMSFELDAHRMQKVAHAEEILWIDDSKATNAHAADASLTSFKSVVWIVGGLLKGQSLDDLISNHARQLRAVIVIGKEQREVLSSLARHAPNVPVFKIDPRDTESVMSKAVAVAKEQAEKGDTVLLSPAAASMDQFLSYEDRGQKFQDSVIKIIEGGGEDGRAGATSWSSD